MGIFENTILVNKKVSGSNMAGRIVCIILAVFCLLISFTIIPGLLLIPAFVFFGIFYLLHIEAQTEYEYTYIEGRLSFAKVKAKRKRKELAEIEMEEVLLIAPADSAELRLYHNDRRASRKDFTSRTGQAPVYEVVYKPGEDVAMIAFEPDVNMLELIRSRYGSKVIMADVHSGRGK